jgi:holo-[acyl-carrier protein] synthase
MPKVSKKTQATLRAAQTIPVTDGQQAGLGVVLVELQRMQHVLNRTPRFEHRIFTSAERMIAMRRPKPAVYYAQLFAAKCAVLKALGGDSPLPLTMLADVEIVADKNGRPKPELTHRAAQIAEQRGIIDIQLSLSFTHQVAAASAVAITQDNRPRKDTPIDPYAQLAQQFKDLRPLLDEL